MNINNMECRNYLTVIIFQGNAEFLFVARLKDHHISCYPIRKLLLVFDILCSKDYHL